VKTAPHALRPRLRSVVYPWIRIGWGGAPEFAVVALVSLALAAAITASLGIHRPYTTLPLAVVFTWGVWLAVRPHTTRHSPAARLASTWALLGVALWIVVGIVLTGEYLIVTRDPGFLTLTGVWLTDHASSDIPTLGAIEVAELQRNLLADAWQAWNLDGTMVQPQGARALSALISVGGWIAGVPGVLAANVVVGGVGVLALYNLARRFLSPLAALAPAAAFALTVSHLALSRSAYSEPLTLLLVVASIHWAWRGLAHGRPWALVVAGVASGATALVRIDGGAYAFGVLAGVAMAAAFKGPQARSGLIVFGVSQGLMVGAGYASLARWSAAYLDRLGDEARLLDAVYGVALLVLILWSLTWSTSAGARLRGWVDGRRTSVARTAALVMIAASAVLVSRPWWMTARRGTTAENNKFTNSVVESFQRAEGYPIDPTRTYAEHTVTWLSYYLTWPLLALAAVGLAVLAYRAVATRAESWVFLGAVLTPSLLYLLRPQIVPDQLWAIRRLEPATLPGLVLAAGVGAWWLARRLATRWPHRTRQFIATAAIIMVAAPVTTYVSIRPSADDPVLPAVYTYVQEQDGARAQIDSLCDVADGRPIILAGTSSHFGSLRVMCDVPVVLALDAPTPETLQQATEIWGVPPVVLTQESDWFWETAPAPVVTATMYQGEYALQHMPRYRSQRNFTWYAGIVTTDGSLTALNPDGAPAS
jgi:hypothetical protein